MEQIDPVSDLFALAQRHNVPMSAICQEAGVAATTPSRWRHNRNSANLETVSKLRTALGAILASRSDQADAA